MRASEAQCYKWLHAVALDPEMCLASRHMNHLFSSQTRDLIPTCKNTCQASHFSLLPEPPVKPGSGHGSSKIFTDFEFASDTRLNFRDNLVLDLTHAHATRFENNGASHTSGYLLRLSCWRKWHATSHELSHLMSSGNWCHATSCSRNTLHQGKNKAPQVWTRKWLGDVVNMGCVYLNRCCSFVLANASLTALSALSLPNMLQLENTCHPDF